MSEQKYDDSPLKAPKQAQSDMMIFMVVFGILSCGAIFIGLLMGVLIITIFGMIFFVTAFIGIYPKFRPRIMKVALANDVTAIETDFLELRMATSNVGDYPALRLRTQWLDTKNNKVYHFFSQDIYIEDLKYLHENPEYISPELKSAEITVMANPENLKEYYFEDTEILRIIEQFITPNLEIATPILKRAEWKTMQKALEAEMQKNQKQE
ncbi:hypothetical protein [Ignatzschineria sp. LJL83]